jgi:hypothetical protein
MGASLPPCDGPSVLCMDLFSSDVLMQLNAAAIVVSMQQKPMHGGINIHQTCRRTSSEMEASCGGYFDKWAVSVSQ